MKKQNGFSLIELISVLIIVSVIAYTMPSRFNFFSTAGIQASRDDIIAALFYAQQTSMARNNIELVISATEVSVKENGNPILISRDAYPVKFPKGVAAVPITFAYDKLGHTTAGTVTLTNSSGDTTSIKVEASGYVH